MIPAESDKMVAPGEPKTADNFNPEEAENLEDVCAPPPQVA